MDTAADLLVSQLGKPALDQVQPGATGWREVKMEAWMTNQPALDGWSLVSGVVVEDEVDIELRRDFPINEVQEPAELLGSVALMELTDDAALTRSRAANREVVPWRK